MDACCPAAGDDPAREIRHTRSTTCRSMRNTSCMTDPRTVNLCANQARQAARTKSKTSANGTRRKCRHCSLMLAIGGNSENIWSIVPFYPKVATRLHGAQKSWGRPHPPVYFLQVYRLLGPRLHCFSALSAAMQCAHSVRRTARQSDKFGPGRFGDGLEFTHSK